MNICYLQSIMNNHRFADYTLRCSNIPWLQHGHSAHSGSSNIPFPTSKARLMSQSHPVCLHARLEPLSTSIISLMTPTPSRWISNYWRCSGVFLIVPQRVFLIMPPRGCSLSGPPLGMFGMHEIFIPAKERAMASSMSLSAWGWLGGGKQETRNETCVWFLHLAIHLLAS